MKQQYNYEIVVESQLGPRHGMLYMEENDDIISGNLSLLGFKNRVSGERDGQIFRLRHQLRTLVSHFSCQTELDICGDTLSGRICFDRGSMKIHGKRAAKTEDRKS